MVRVKCFNNVDKGQVNNCPPMSLYLMCPPMSLIHTYPSYATFLYLPYPYTPSYVIYLYALHAPYAHSYGTFLHPYYAPSYTPSYTHLCPSVCLMPPHVAIYVPSYAPASAPFYAPYGPWWYLLCPYIPSYAPMPFRAPQSPLCVQKHICKGGLAVEQLLLDDW